MKKITAALLCLCLLLVGCAPAAVDSPEPSAQIESIRRSIQTEDGTELLSLSYPRFQLQLPDAKIANSIQTHLNAQTDLLFSPAEDLEQIVREAYDQQLSWNPWFANIHGSVERLDEGLLSVYLVYEEFCGSAHPNYATYSITYDCQSGNVLELADLLTDDMSVATLSIPLQKQLLPLADQLFDDYEAIVSNLLTQERVSNWYLSGDGLCFHFAPYGIAPYTTGTVVVTIPYADLEGIVQATYLQ